jgi:hypothetical protein
LSCSNWYAHSTRWQIRCRKASSNCWIHMKLPLKDGCAYWIFATMKQADIQNESLIWLCNLRAKHTWRKMRCRIFGEEHSVGRRFKSVSAH